MLLRLVARVSSPAAAILRKPATRVGTPALQLSREASDIGERRFTRAVKRPHAITECLSRGGAGIAIGFCIRGELRHALPRAVVTLASLDGYAGNPGTMRFP